MAIAGLIARLEGWVHRQLARANPELRGRLTAEEAQGLARAALPADAPQCHRETMSAALIRRQERLVWLVSSLSQILDGKLHFEGGRTEAANYVVCVDDATGSILSVDIPAHPMLIGREAEEALSERER